MKHKPIYWVHDESCSKGIVFTEQEAQQMCQEPLVDIVGKESYDSRVDYDVSIIENNLNKAQSAGAKSMSFFKPMEEQDLEYEGFNDGQNKTIPDNYETTCLVTDGFHGIEEGKAQQVLFLNVMITEPGEFYGQKYKYNAKIYDMDATKRDRAMSHLGVVDAQAGFPMTNGQMEPTTENIQDYWAGAAECRVKFGMMVQKEDYDGNPLLDENGAETVRYLNFVRGFAYLREKMRKPAQADQPQQQQQPAYEQPKQTQQVPAEGQLVDDDIDF